ncbi:hypothetical protein BO99DRAFT_398516 [Aspergillus violaceofuscus CBS 115571]|uniref:Uncharacterized protein n=1 Tax=Aspergillus violaceofuscus (strain CBS 115571) TaxID=1450538 RepID=A0A2V5HJL9_ASPV1|nr:hypothetical protein BO99DRAFT_398516 [Aspergillus violaceofuscus CBS 115571]
MKSDEKTGDLANIIHDLCRHLLSISNNARSHRIINPLLHRPRLHGPPPSDEPVPISPATSSAAALSPASAQALPDRPSTYSTGEPLSINNRPAAACSRAGDGATPTPTAYGCVVASTSTASLTTDDVHCMIWG